ncbi:MAG: heparinase II/III family protein [Alphaproteobacteria bacterium]
MSDRAKDSKFIDPARALSRNMRQRLQQAYYGTAIYRRVLKGPHPVRIKYSPKDHWGGEADTANALFRGEYRFAGQTVSAPNGNPFRLNPPSQAWADALHGFRWLRHFRAHGGEAAQRHVEALIRSWLEDYDNWEAIAWQPEVIASRLIAWMSNAPVAVNTEDLVYHSAVMNSMARQARHLSRTAEHSRDGLPRLQAVIGLIYSGFCLPEGARRFDKGMRQLERELDRLILPDGGIATRNPTDQFEALKALVALKSDLRSANQDIPTTIQRSIDRMAPMLRFFRHADGGLALFNGSFEEKPEEVEQVLAAAEAEGKPLGGAIYSGFQRVQSHDVLLIMDAGGPPEDDLSIVAHAGVNSFELSVGNDRLIVNCGSSEQLTTDGWQKVSRTTAAHSALVIDNRNSSSILDNQRIGRPPKKVSAVRDEMEDLVALDVTHNGYVPLCGYEHERVLRVHRNGKEVEGLDALKAVARVKGKNLRFDLRFHLHPDVVAAPTLDGAAVDLTLPGGALWRFECTLGVILEESVYLGERGHIRRSQQIVVSGDAGGQTHQVNWRLQKTN